MKHTRFKPILWESFVETEYILEYLTSISSNYVIPDEDISSTDDNL